MLKDTLQMRLLACFFVASSLLLAICIPVKASPRSSLAGVGLWVNLIGSDQESLAQSGQLEDLNKFQLVVVDVDSTGGDFTTDTVAELRAEGVIVLSYLNLGSCEDFRWYWRTACAENRLAPYENYPDEFWMNVSSPSWKKAIVNIIAPPLVARGIDGFYLDNLDVVEGFSDIQGLADGLHDIVIGLQSTYPAMLLVAQNGLYAMNHTGSDGKPLWSEFDALAHEDVFATYDFQSSQYIPQAPATTAELVSGLTCYQRLGLKIFTVDYADTTDLAMQAVEGSLSHNFTPYVGPIELDSIAWWAYNRVQTTSTTTSSPPSSTPVPTASSTTTSGETTSTTAASTTRLASSTTSSSTPILEFPSVGLALALSISTVACVSILVRAKKDKEPRQQRDSPR